MRCQRSGQNDDRGERCLEPDRHRSLAQTSHRTERLRAVKYKPRVDMLCLSVVMAEPSLYRRFRPRFARAGKESWPALRNAVRDERVAQAYL